MHRWNWTDQGPPLWSGDLHRRTTADGPNSCSRGYKPCAIENERRSGCALQQNLMREERPEMRTYPLCPLGVVFRTTSSSPDA